jgi:hypothetical protein
VLWVTRGVTLGALALGVGAIGETLLFQERTRSLGAWLLVGAMALAVVAWNGRPATSWRVHRSPRTAVSATRVLRWAPVALRLAGIVGALGLAGAALLAWEAEPEAVFGRQGVLWVASVALLLAASARWYSATQSEAALGPPWTRAEGLVFAGLILLSLGTHLTSLDAIPWRFHYDEVIAHIEALRFYQGPQISLFTTTWVNTSLPSGWFAVPAGLMWLFGDGLGSSRLGVALLGALTVIPVYGLARVAWGRTAAALAAFALAVSAAAVHYSRISITNSTTPFCWAVCFYFLLRGLRSRRPGDFTWAGLAAGFSMYTYYGTRLLPYLLLAFGGYLALFHFRTFREQLGLLALVPVGFVVGFGPLLAYFLRYPAAWAGRGLEQLTVPPTIPTTWAGWTADWAILAPLMDRNLLGVSVLPSGDSCYWAPLLLPVEAVLFWLGAGVLIARWRQPAAFLVVLWLGGVLFVGGTLVGERFVPALNHWTPAFPAFYLVLALPPTLWLRALRRTGPRLWRVGWGMVGVGLAALAVANAYTYLVAYPPRVPPAFASAQGRFFATLGPHDRVWVVGHSWETYYPEVKALLAPAIRVSVLLNPSRELPLIADPDDDLVFLFNTDMRPYLPLVQAYYPGGQVAPLQTPGGPVGVTYRVPAAQARARYGVLLTVAGPAGSGPAWQGAVPAVGALPLDLPTRYPLTATWSGALFVPEAGPLRLAVVGGTASTTRVQGQATGPPTPLLVDAGWVPFEVQARLSGPAPLRLLVQQGAGPPAPPAPRHLWPQPADAGLAVTLVGATVSQRIDPFVGTGVLGPTSRSRWLPPPTERDPALVPLAVPSGPATRLRWAGEVYAEGGAYRMALRTDAPARLWIDGALVLDLCANHPPADGLPVHGDEAGRSAPVELVPGWHQVQLDLDPTGVDNGLEWTWTRPDGVHEIVPPARLRLSAGGGPTHPARWPVPPGPITCSP